MTEHLATFQPRRILVRGVNWLGDAVMTTPALQRLREALPGSLITLLTHEKLAYLWRHHPSIDHVLTFSPSESPWSVSRRLRWEGYETALVLPNSPRSALEVWLARIPHRIGYPRLWRNWFLTQAVRPRPGYITMRKRSVSEIKRMIRPVEDQGHHLSRITHHASRSAHQIHEYLHLVASLGANPAPVPPQLHVMPSEISAVAERFGLQPDGNPPRPLFGLNPGAEYGPAKRWPSERFIAAAREIQKRTNCLWLIFGGKSDAALASEIQSAISVPHSALNLAAKTSLREFMALLKLFRAL